MTSSSSLENFMSNASPAHQRLVTASVNAMLRNGMTNIRAAGVSGYQQPEPISGMIPDATGYHQSGFCIVEAETSDGLSLAHTATQLRVFYREANRVGGFLILSVSNADKTTAEVLLRSITGGAQNATVWAF
jgi:hypothetical protein